MHNLKILLILISKKEFLPFKNYLLVFFIAFGFVNGYVLFPAQVLAKDSVTWMLSDFPPYTILKGEYDREGKHDKVFELLQEHLPDYEHHEMTGSVTRLLSELGAGEKVCTTLLKTPEREKFIYYSIPMDFDPPLGVTIKRNKAALFKNTKELSFNELLQNKQLQLGIQSGRSYGKMIDPLLEKYKGQKHIYLREGKELYEGLLKMLMSDRLDYIIGYPVETVYVGKMLGIEDKVMNIPLKEHLNAYSFACIACSKTEWGRQIIEKINIILRKQRPTKHYRSIEERWLDKNVIESYRKAYDSIFLKTDK